MVERDGVFYRIEENNAVLESCEDIEGELVIPDEVFNFIANNVTENVRDLEGILVSLQANAVINNREIDLPLTKRVISQAVRL